VLTIWDTTVASRIQPDTAVAAHVIARAALGEPVHVAAPAALEVAYGLELKAPADVRYRRLLAWYTGLIAQGSLEVVPFDGRAAIVAGRLRAQAPHPPRIRRGDRRSRTMRQASWLLDIQIAATAFAAGLEVASANRADFEALSGLLADIYAEAPGLVVAEPPV
jgi:predicted nucleic acid-binding protein